MTMSIQAEPSTLHWVAVGGAAYGLVLGGRIVALVYWEDADVAEADGEPVVTDAGFTWVLSHRPWEHFYLFPAGDPEPSHWARARGAAAAAYFDWAYA
jgi:hypothetical protein